MDTQRRLDRVSEEFSISHTLFSGFIFTYWRIYIDKLKLKLKDRYEATKRSHYPHQNSQTFKNIIKIPRSRNSYLVSLLLCLSFTSILQHPYYLIHSHINTWCYFIYISVLARSSICRRFVFVSSVLVTVEMYIYRNTDEWKWQLEVLIPITNALVFNILITIQLTYWNCRKYR